MDPAAFGPLPFCLGCLYMLWVRVLFGALRSIADRQVCQSNQYVSSCNTCCFSSSHQLNLIERVPEAAQSGFDLLILNLFP